MAIRTQTGLTVDYDVPVPMSDGTVLAADVYRPVDDDRHPVILIRTPYDKLGTPGMAGMLGFDVLAAARAGYAVVIQDTRGAFRSDGTFRHFAHEADDGVDSIAWAAAQDWSDGAVGMSGASYFGATQLLAATRRPQALRAIVPTITSSEYYEGWTYQGGALQLGFTLWWAAGMAFADLMRAEGRGEDVSAGRAELEQILADPWAAYERLPLLELARSTPWLRNYAEWLEHPERDDYWRATAINERYGQIDVPALHIAGWNDIFLKGSLENYVGLRAGAASEHARANQRLIVSPWGHAAPAEVMGELWLGAAAAPIPQDLPGVHLSWFDALLRGEQLAERAPVRIFVLGANRWRDEDDWPLARATATRFYLHARGGLSQAPPADEPPSQFVYDPRDPVPTVGGQTLMAGGGFFLGPRDRRRVEDRPDVLVFTTDVLQQDVEVTGPVTATLHVSTSCRDTDFTATLVDVHPDGRAIGVTDGILRLRYREGLDRTRLAEPGQVYEIEVDLVATSNVFHAGHRIRLEISSSNFPRFDRNPNHGGVIAEASESDLRAARQRVFHDVQRPSFVTLPLVPT